MLLTSGRQAIFWIFFSGYSVLERILLTPLERIDINWVAVRVGQTRLVYFMLVYFVLELLDQKKLGNFFNFPHKMKKDHGKFLLAMTSGLAKLLHLRVANILYLYHNITKYDR